MFNPLDVCGESQWKLLLETGRQERKNKVLQR